MESGVNTGQGHSTAEKGKEQTVADSGPTSPEPGRSERATADRIRSDPGCGEVGQIRVRTGADPCQNYYHATKRACSIKAPVHLELTMTKSHHGHLNVVMVSSMTSAFYSANMIKS